MDKMLKLYLNSASLDHQSVMGLFESLEAITYNIPTLLGAPVSNVNLVWSVTREILGWIQRQRQKVFFFYLHVAKRRLI